MVAKASQVIDPTANVIALNEAAVQRQDDLRDLNNKYLDARLDAMQDMAILRSEHAKEIREIETKRLDAIRQVDAGAVSTAAERSQAAIQALAATTTANAENLRNALTATAATIAAQTASTVAEITKRISALEMSSYVGAGKQAVADPQLAALFQKMESLVRSRATVSGKSAGISTAWLALLGLVSLLGGLLGIGGVLFAVLRR